MLHVGLEIWWYTETINVSQVSLRVVDNNIFLALILFPWQCEEPHASDGKGLKVDSLQWSCLILSPVSWFSGILLEQAKHIFCCQMPNVYHCSWTLNRRFKWMDNTPASKRHRDIVTITDTPVDQRSRHTLGPAFAWEQETDSEIP